MKNKLTKLIMFAVSVTVAASLFTFMGCNTNSETEEEDPATVVDTPEDTTGDDSESDDSEESTVTKQEILDYISSLNNLEIDGVNTYATNYDDMVAYLREQGVITVSDEEAVDMNTTAGYFVGKTWNDDYTGYTSYTNTEAVQFADEAYDFGGVYLIWWDLSGSYTSYRTFSTGTTIQIGGGEYTLTCSAVSGAYALAFADVVEAYATDRDPDLYSDYTAWTEYQNSLVAAAEEKNATAISVFNSIDSTPNSIEYYSLSDLVTALRSAGYLTALDVVNGTDLNAVYTYDYNGTTCYVYFASSAMKYGNISIYYYDTSYSWYSFTSFPTILANLEASGSSPIYYDTAYGNSYYCFGTDNIYTYTGTEYDENGEQLILTVDLVVGNFAIVVDES